MKTAIKLATTMVAGLLAVSMFSYWMLGRAAEVIAELGDEVDIDWDDWDENWAGDET